MALWCTLDANGGRDDEIERAGVERDKLRQQAENALGIFSAAARNAIELALETHVGKATVTAVAAQAEDPGIFAQIQGPAHDDVLFPFLPQDASEKLVDPERRAGHDLVFHGAERRSNEVEHERVARNICRPGIDLAARTMPG